MANNDYLIKYSNNKDTITVKENVIDNDKISLALVGHGHSNYGAAQNTNFLHLLENFASAGDEYEPEPQHPVVGQLWFNNMGGGKFKLNVCSELSNSGEPTWTELLQNITSDSGPYPMGTLYYDSANKKLKVWDTTVGDSGDWIAVGPTDVVHTEHTFSSILVEPQQSTAEHMIDINKICEDIKETSNPGIQGNGALNLVKMTILAKEFKENNGTLSKELAKSCVWIYKFIIRSVNTSAGKIKEMVGAPNYELIGQNPEDLDWDVDVSIDNSLGDPQLKVRFSFGVVPTNYVSIGFDSEITRI